MFEGPEIENVLAAVGITHAVWIPDSTTGQWEDALQSSKRLQLVRVCREGEAWPLAAGLYVGGQRPLVIIQTTGLFESGDALRNIYFDLHLPILAVVGARNWLVADLNDSAKTFAQPILDAWGIPYEIIEHAGDKPRMKDCLARWQQAQQPGMVLVGEGRE